MHGMAGEAVEGQAVIESGKPQRKDRYLAAVGKG